MKELIHEFIKEKPRSRKEISGAYYLPIEKVDGILVELYNEEKVFLYKGKWKSTRQ